VASRRFLSLVHTNFDLARGDVAVIDNVLMNLASLNLGTPLHRASSSQVFQASWEMPMEGTRWVLVQGLKLEARDQMTEESSTSIAISQEEGELEEESKGGGWWREWSSQTMSLIATTSSTCERVTGEGSGFREAMGTRGKPGVGVCDSTNSGDMCEDPRPAEGVMAERGDRLGGGVAEARGHRAA
jgi:hypothetical protein